jgi:hypothetical protein
MREENDLLVLPSACKPETFLKNGLRPVTHSYICISRPLRAKEGAGKIMQSYIRYLSNLKFKHLTRYFYM